MIQHTIWNEKYRSEKLENFIAKEELIETLSGYIEKNDIPHLLFFGTPGSGKTTLAKLLTKNLKCDYLFLNASDENGIDTIRDKVQAFASSASFKPLKIVVLDEADYLTGNAQAVLRNIIEKFSRTTRFILTGNYIERISEALQSRCDAIKLEPPSKKEVAVHVAGILKAEGVTYDVKDIAFVIQNYYPDNRRIINSLQSFSQSGTLKVPSTLSSNYRDEIYKMLSSKSKTAWVDVRQTIVNNDLRDFQDLYKYLYDKYFDNPEVVIILAEYQYKQAFVVDKEICFMACIAKLIETTKKKVI